MRHVLDQIGDEALANLFESKVIGHAASAAAGAVGADAAVDAISMLPLPAPIKKVLMKNSKHMGDYISKGTHILRFPLLATEYIDTPLVSKFCAMLQIEKAEYVRQYLYNNKVSLNGKDSELAKEFTSNFYEDREVLVKIFDDCLNEGLELDVLSEVFIDMFDVEELTEAMHISGGPNPGQKNKLMDLLKTQQTNKAKHFSNKPDSKSNLDQKKLEVFKAKVKHEYERKKADYTSKKELIHINSAQGEGQLWGKGLSINKSDLHPINPTMVNVVLDDDGKNQRYQIVGIRYIPHKIPFNEIQVAFKYGILNSRMIDRFIKFLLGDLHYKDYYRGTDKAALDKEFTKISLDKKSWATGVKDSTHAVSMLITKQEFDFICEKIVDLKKPMAFKVLEKAVGLLDLIIVDKDAKMFYRINAFDNYQMVHYDIRDVLTADQKDLVVNARIDAQSLRRGD